MKSLVIPAIWLALSTVIYSRITLFFVLNHLCSKSRHSFSTYKLTSCLIKSHPFALYCIISVLGTKILRCELKAFLFLLLGKKASLFLLGQINIDTDWILRFQNGCNKVVFELCVVLFWSEIILVISNWTSDQIALHSVQLPLCTYTVGSIFMISLIMVMQSLSLTFYTFAKVKVFFWGYN